MRLDCVASVVWNSLCRLATRWLVIGTVFASLTSCYLPDKFISEIQLGNNGDFAITYRGDLIWAPLFRDIAKNKVPAADIPNKVEMLRKDLARDSSFSKVESRGNGRFYVEYHREGHLQGTDLATFVRRNAIILELHATPDGKITVDGNTIQPGQAVEATSLGLNVEGEFRIITGGQVLYNNATAIRAVGPYTLYIWTIENAFSPAPHFVLQREGNWPKK